MIITVEPLLERGEMRETSWQKAGVQLSHSQTRRMVAEKQAEVDAGEAAAGTNELKDRTIS